MIHLYFTCWCEGRVSTARGGGRLKDFYILRFCANNNEISFFAPVNVLLTRRSYLLTPTLEMEAILLVFVILEREMERLDGCTHR